MSHQIELTIRLTHKYRQGYAYLDRYQHLGLATQIAAGKVRHAESGESYNQLLVFEVDAPKHRPENIQRALRDTLAHGCTCEHDCCACTQSYVWRVRKLKGSRYAVLRHSFLNI